jgi:glutathione peroxidase
MKKFIFAAIPLLLFSFIIPSGISKNMKTTSIYEFKVPALTGGTIDFSNFKGKKLLIVNTASKCGNTPQYDDLENLYKNIKTSWLLLVFLPIILLPRNPEPMMK